MSLKVQPSSIKITGVHWINWILRSSGLIVVSVPWCLEMKIHHVYENKIQ